MKTIKIRFYAELNDFLPRYRKHTPFELSFPGNARILFIIEMLGVPHSQVDLIVVNGNCVDFNYLLQDGDRVSVYPVFESIDITNINHLRPEPLRYTTFILDAHLGRLAKYLRMCGFDCFYADLPDEQIVSISLEEHRIILTKDRGLLRDKRVTHGYWVRSLTAKDQLREVISRFDLANNIEFLTRCLLCNNKLEKVSVEQIVNLVPAKIASSFQNFYCCAQCNKVYWEGGHYHNMVQLIQNVLSDISRNSRW